MTLRRAFITGITGQDGTHLSRWLLGLGESPYGKPFYEYAVYGFMRRQSTPPLDNLRRAGILGHPHFKIIEGDLTDAGSLLEAMSVVKPDEVYNLAAQSHVGTSFKEPVHTSDVTALGVLRVLDAIRLCGLKDHARFYQAGSSEMFGAASPPQDENTGFIPRSPYGAAKLAGHWFTRIYREAYGMHTSTGILFNHEGEFRGPNFVTRKITRYVAALARSDVRLPTAHRIPKDTVPLQLGNIYAKRDWGYAGDYVVAMWKMLQQEKADDYVIGTGVVHSVKDFIEAAFRARFETPLRWEGEGVNEVAFLNEQKVVEISQQFYRPLEVDNLRADPSKAAKRIGWEPKTTFGELVKFMVDSDSTLILKS